MPSALGKQVRKHPEADVPGEVSEELKELTVALQCRTKRIVFPRKGALVGASNALEREIHSVADRGLLTKPAGLIECLATDSPSGPQHRPAHVVQHGI